MMRRAPPNRRDARAVWLGLADPNGAHCDPAMGEWRIRVSRTRAAGGLAAGLAAGLLLLLLLLAGCATDLSRAELATEYVVLGAGYLGQDQPEQAIGYLERALELQPDTPGARFHLARALIRAERAAAAAPHLKVLLAAAPDNLRVLELQAAALQQRGRRREALAVYRTLLQLHPAHHTARYNAAMLLWAGGDRAAAADHLRTLLDHHPDDQEARYQLGVLLAEAELPDEAAAVLSRYLEAEPTDVDALVALARVETRRRRYLAALDAYQPAIAALQERGSPAPAGGQGNDARGRLAELQFERAVILLTAVEDPYAGLAALEAALAGGFDDPQRLAALLAEPNLLLPEQVQRVVASTRASVLGR